MHTVDEKREMIQICKSTQRKMSFELSHTHGLTLSVCSITSDEPLRRAIVINLSTTVSECMSAHMHGDDTAKSVNVACDVIGESCAVCRVVN